MDGIGNILHIKFIPLLWLLKTLEPYFKKTLRTETSRTKAKINVCTEDIKVHLLAVSLISFIFYSSNDILVMYNYSDYNVVHYKLPEHIVL